MRSKRYTIVVADRRTGVVRRFTLSLWPTLMTVSGVLALPVLIGTGASLKARYEVASIYAAASSLEIENNNYRIATEALSGQIQGLQAAITELGAKAALDPSLQSAMDKLPAVVKSRAMGGGSTTAAAIGALPALQSPENTFGLLRELLQGIESRLSSVRADLDKRNALAAATPSIWPAHGWLTSRVGTRAGSDHRRTRFPSRTRYFCGSWQPGVRDGRRPGVAGRAADRATATSSSSITASASSRATAICPATRFGAARR